MRIRFWGTRGSIPSPGQHTVRYGGNTSCTELRADDGTLLIFDCGTGARGLGLHLLRERPVRAHLLIGHSHWDHIQGFPFFVPAFEPDSEITVYAPPGFQQSLEQAMVGQMHYAYFPVKLRDLHSRIRFINIDEGVFRIGGLIVETQYLNHTAPTIGYRISSGGTTVVYATDHEPFLTSGVGYMHPGDQRHIEFLSQADLVIHDAQYSTDEYPQKLGWGHSTVDYATEVAIAAGVKRLALFHHDPTHDDVTLHRMEVNSRSHAAALRSDIQVFSAAEGAEVHLPEARQPAVWRPAPSAFNQRLTSGARVLIATGDTDEATLIVDIMVSDGIEPMVVTNRSAVLSETHRLRPDVVILDMGLWGPDVFAFAQRVHGELRSAHTALILLATGLNEETIQRAKAAGITDCLAKPFSPPMLHARVRMWLARTYGSAQTENAAAPIEIRELRAQAEPLAVHSPVVDTLPLPPAQFPRVSRQTQRKAAILAATPLFGILNEEMLQQLARLAKLKDYPAGTPISQQGDREHSLYVIASGRVRVVGRAPDARAAEILLGELGPGEVFGELSVIDDLPHSATVVAVNRTRCLVLGQEEFLLCVESSQTFGFRLARLLTQRLREADRLLLRDGPDALTGLGTRRTLEQVYRRDAAAARRRGYNLALLFLDIDRLKTINDTHGHLAGDDAIQVVADALRSATRESDIAARVGGDEFVALLSDTGDDGVRLVKARIQRRLEELAKERGLPMPVTCSIGYTIADPPPASLEEMMQAADAAMYLEKRSEADRSQAT